MLIAEADVETERSSRYLVQLCQHVDKVGRAHPQMRAHVEWSDDRGVISFDWGRCTLRAPGRPDAACGGPRRGHPAAGGAAHRRSPRADRQARPPDGDLDTAPGRG